MIPERHESVPLGAILGRTLPGDPAGHVTGSLRGDDRDVKGKKRDFTPDGLFFLRKRITSDDRTNFFLQLGILLESKVSLHRSLVSLSHQTKKKTTKELIFRLAKDVESGKSLSQAISAHPGTFDHLTTSTLEVGEETGHLSEVLLELARHGEKVQALKKKFLQAITYPSLVMAVASFAVLFLLAFIVPTFGEMFKSFQMEDIPLSTRLVLRLSKIVTESGGYLLISLALAGTAALKLLSVKRVKESAWSALLRLPLIGGIATRNYTARFCRTLGTLLLANVSLLTALDVTRKMMAAAATKELEQDIDQMIQEVRRGKAMTEHFTESLLFPPIVAQMISVGEETSELDRMLIRVAEYYEKEIDAIVERLSSVIEPALILLLGFIVGGILVSMYLPMFDLVNVVGAQR